MRKGLLILLLSIAIGVVGCGGNNDPIDQVTDAVTETTLSIEEYTEMLLKYSDIFTEELSVISELDIIKELEQNSDMSTLKKKVTDTLTKAEKAELTLQDYYEEFDKDRTAPPMGTKIMTLLSHARSALRRYVMTLEYAESYLDRREQKYIEKVDKYWEKTTEALGDYDSLLAEEMKDVGYENNSNPTDAETEKINTESSADDMEDILSNDYLQSKIEGLEKIRVNL